MKKVLSLVLVLTLVLGSFSFAFADEPTDNARVNKLIDMGLVLGDAGGYRLNDTITRAEAAVMVVKAQGLQAVAEASKYASSFKDVPSTHWALGYINVVAGRGIVSGYPDGTFRPDANISYAEIITMMVQILGGLNEQEAKAPWPANYITKASELGILEDVAVANFGEVAIRERVFEIVYNTIANNKVGDYDIVKAIVLENSRVETLDSDEIVVEVIQDVQKSKYADESRQIKGEQYVMTVPAKVADVENLLGKVVDITFDKAYNVVAVKEDTTYKVVTGAIGSVSKDKITVAGKSYTVSIDERYKGADERIFRTYHNDKAYAYDDFYRNVKDAEFARITVKNGKVLFIDAYTFTDIAPVKEVKKDGAEVYVYNDYRDARVEKYSPSRVVSFSDKEGFLVSTKADIKANDVIHVYQVGTKTNVIVKKDALVEGTYEKVKQDQYGYWAYVDGEAYYINDVDYKRPVYSYNSKDYMTLVADKASSALWDFKDEEVAILIDINGDLQLVGATIDYNEGFAIIDEILSKGKVRLIQPSNDKVVLEETFDSYLAIPGTTKNQQLSVFDKGDLVFVVNDEENIDTMERIATVEQIRNGRVDEVEGKNVEIFKGARLVQKDAVTKFVMNNDLIKVVDKVGEKEVETRYNILPRTNVFRVNFNKDGSVKAIVGTTISAVRTGAKANTDLKATIITDADVDALELGNRVSTSGRADVAHTIIFTNYTGSASYDYETIRVTAKETSPRWIIGVDDEGNTIERSIATAAASSFNAVKIGDIVELSITKDDAKTVQAIDVRIANDADTYRVVSVTSKTGYRTVVLADRYDREQEFWISNDALEFGTIATDLVVQYDVNAYGDIDVLRVYPKSKKVTGVFGEPGTELPEDAVEFKGVFELDGNTFVQLENKTYPYVGKEDLKEIEVGTMVIPTFAEVRGETVVTKLEVITEEPALK